MSMRFASPLALALLLAAIALPATAAPTRKITTFAIGCTDREDLSRLVKLAVSGDKEAFGTLAARQIASGSCRPFDEGTDVFIEDTSLFSGVTCVRPKGDPDCYWVQVEFISKD